MAPTPGWAYVGCEDFATGSGPTGSLQYLDHHNQITGSDNLYFQTASVGPPGKPDYAAYTLVLTGTLIVSGTISASHYHIEDITEIDTTGSTKFGNTNDDIHQRTGSLGVNTRTNDQSLLWVTSSGDSSYNPLVGIGTEDPTHTLTVIGDISGSSTLQAVGATTLGDTLNVSGNVGIGTTPSALVHVYKAATTLGNPAEMLRLEINDEGVDMNIGSGPSIDFYVGETGGSNYGGSVAVVREVAGDADSAAAMAFHTATDDEGPDNAREKMRITSTGKVGIGTNDPDHALTVVGTVSGSSTLQAVGATTLGSTLNVTGAVSGAVGFTGASWTSDGSISGSSTLQAVGAATLGSTLDVSGAYSGSSLAVGSAIGQGALGAGDISGSSTLQIVGATYLGSTLSVSGAISGAVGVSGSDARFEGVVSAGSYFGDGSPLTGVPDISGTPSNDQIALWTDADTLQGVTGLTYVSAGGVQLQVVGGISGSAQLHAAGNSFLEGTLNVSGAYSGSSIALGNATGRGDLGVGEISGSSTLQVVGATYLGNTLNVSGTVSVAQKIDRAGDTDTYIEFTDDSLAVVAGGEEMILALQGGGGDQADKVTINNNDQDVDFQVKGASVPNLLRTDAANDRVGIGHPAGDLAGTDTLTVVGTISGSSTLQIVGATYLGNTLNVSGAATVKGNATLGDASTDVIAVTGRLTASAGLFSEGNVGIGIAPSATDILKVGGGISGSSTLQIVGATYLGNTLNVSGAATVKGNATLGDAVTDITAVTGRLTASVGLFSEGNVGIGGEPTAADTLKVAGSLNVTGDTTLGDASTDITAVTGRLTASAGLFSEGNVGIGIAPSATDTLKVGGGISGSSTLQIVGATILGSTLNVSGAISGAVGVSGSDARFEGAVSAGYYFGDGSNLSNLPAGPAGPGGIFTTVDGSSAYVTSSIAIGAETAASSPHILAMSGALSASSNVSASAFYGSSLSSSANLGLTASAGGVVGTGQVGVAGSLSASLGISALTYYGDGQNLTNLASAAISSYSLASDNRLITCVNASSVQGEANLTFDGDILTVTGDVTASSVTTGRFISAVAAIGDANATLATGFNVMTADMTAPRTYTLPGGAALGDVVRIKVNGSAATHVASVTGSSDPATKVTIDGSGAALSLNSPYSAANFVCYQTSASFAAPALWMIF